jgi:hypothetical protein
VVADTFYGEDRGESLGLRDLKVGYVLAFKPSHAWWHPQEEIGSFQEAAVQAGWKSAKQPGRWGTRHADLPGWLVARLVGLGTRYPSLWTREARARRDRHD